MREFSHSRFLIGGGEYLGWGGKLRFAKVSTECFSDSIAVSANSGIGSPISGI
ncbi:MAG: hypothetical protein PHY48_17680 [Candidatus Cloacimonetes bacterium]|nr:hypothetical protein [Candidatus Cloacimonadota bacterium]